MRIPDCSPQQPSETRTEYATRVLRHVLDHGTSTLTDAQLVDADSAAQYYATHARSAAGTAQDLEPHQYAILRQFSAARHEIAAAQRLRADWARQAAQTRAQTTNPPTGGTQPGRPAVLPPPPPSGPGQPDALALPRTSGHAPAARQTAGDGIRF